MRQDTELLRIISAIGIVWFHLELPGADFGYGGLIFFVVLGAFFSIDTNQGFNANFLMRRASRIMWPWLAWSAFFAAINVFRGYPPFPKGNSWLAAVLIGPSVHLWYLPFAMLASIASAFAGQLLTCRSRSVLGLSFTVIGLLLVGTLRAEHEALSYPWAQYIHALPAVFLGWALAGMKGEQFRVRIAALCLVALAILPGLFLSGYGLPYLIGLLLAAPLVFPELVAIGIPFNRLSQYTFGIYLVHPFFIPVVRRLGLSGEWVGLPLALALSLGLVALLRRLAPRLGSKVT